MEKHLAELEKRIGYTFTNKDFLAQAFIRSSYSAENGGPNNEVLEFIGDKALDFAVIRIMMGRFSSVADSGKHYLLATKNEKAFTNIKKELVAKKALSASMTALGFQQYLVMGRGDIHGNVQEQDSVKEDLFEAILGAVALDCDWNMDVIARVTQNMIDLKSFFDRLAADEEKMDENYVGKLQEWTQGKFHITPDYSCEETENGFRCLLTVPAAGLCAEGEGTSQKAAKMAAAKALYLNLPKENAFFAVLQSVPQVDDAVGQLKIFADKGMVAVPEYADKPVPGNGVSPNWECTLTVGDFSCRVTAETKKKARQLCAEQAVKYLTQESPADSQKVPCAKEEKQSRMPASASEKDAITQLKEYAEKGIIAKPEYTSKPLPGNGVSPDWEVTLRISEITYTEVASRIEEAKHLCAEAALNDLRMLMN